jgi:hypothetical protein
MRNGPELATATDIVVVDMSSLRLMVDRGRESVTVAHGLEPIVVVPLREIAELLPAASGPADESRLREAVFLLMDRALASGRLTRVTDAAIATRLPVALYNPHTAEVAVGPVPTTRAYSAGVPLPLPESGLVCQLSGDMLVWGDGTELREQNRTFAQMTRVFVAHMG